jgi:hypothetical protein
VKYIMTAAGAALALGCVAKAELPAHPPMREMLVKAGDFQFAASDTIESGYIRIRMENVGQELHHMQLIRLENGLTREEVLAHAGRGELVFPGLKFVGGPSVPGSSKASEVVLDLTPGQYLMVCYMTSGKVRHLLMGMARELTVIPSKGPGAAPPLEDERMILRSYAFDVDSALKPGRHTIRVENSSDEPHEVDIARIPEGGSVEQIMAWLQKPANPPPFDPVGGTMVLSRGESAYVPIDLAAGRYVLLCFVPDAKDGLPHVAHGMVKVITVGEESATDWNAARQQRGRR